MDERIVFTKPDGSVGVEIPTGEVPITEIMAQVQSRPGLTNIRQIDKSQLPDRDFRNAWDDSNPEKFVGINLAKAKNIKIKEAHEKCEDALRVITDKYSEAEQKTWHRQYSEAKAHIADPLAVNPIAYLNPLADARGITVAEMANIIIRKADDFDLTSITEISKRQAMEKAITAIDSVTGSIDDLTAITF